jgi:hypothetical protein
LAAYCKKKEYIPLIEASLVHCIPKGCCSQQCIPNDGFLIMGNAIGNEKGLERVELE